MTIDMDLVDAQQARHILDHIGLLYLYFMEEKCKRIGCWSCSKYRGKAGIDRERIKAFVQRRILDS